MFGFWRMRCACGSTRIRRSSRRNRVENALGMLFLPWRCEDCDRRVYKAAWLHAAPQPPKAGLAEEAADYSARLFDRGTGDSDLN